MLRTTYRVLSLFLSVNLVFAEGGGYTYIQNGADWPDHFPDCKGPNNSPIDLRTPGSNDPHPMVSFSTDKFNKVYTSLLSKKVKWVNNEITKIEVEAADASKKTNFFTSNYGKNVLKTADQFNANQFHFHLASEHTINGRRYDIEMHTVHFPSNSSAGIVASAVGIIFDTKRFDPTISTETVGIIDRFFDSLRLDQINDPTVNEIPFGDLMAQIDTNNRWVYKGSLTTPPCTKLIYWNVVATIYPIKQRHLDQFRAQLGRGQNNLRVTGNFRIVSPIDGHDVVYVSDTVSAQSLTTSEELDQPVLLGILIVTLLFALLACGFSARAYCTKSEDKDSNSKYVNNTVQETEMSSRGPSHK